MKSRRRLHRSLWIIGLLLLGFFFLYRTHYYIEGKGTAEPTANFVKVAGKKDRQKGRFMLTTVGIRGPVTPFEIVVSKISQPFDELVSRQDLMGDEDTKEYDQIQKYYMESSINFAIEAAYKKARQSYSTRYLGVYVMSILDQSTFKNDLVIGDTITAINGQHFKNAEGFVKYVQSLKVGDLVTINYEHNRQLKHATQKLIKLPQNHKAGLGITLTDHSKIDTKIPVKIDAGEIGGPSAGLMFTLQIYDQLTRQNLRRGRQIAGTGTMAPDGTVGPIGGIDKKVAVASEEGAQIFFAPNEKVTKAMLKVDPDYQNNYTIAKAAAKKIHTKMKIVPVRSLNDALTYLKQ